MSKLDELRKEYFELCHAMQSGVAAQLALGQDTAVSPKHLRVGVNVAMNEHSALVKLLTDKGLLTEEEYFTELCAFMRREVEEFEIILSKLTGKSITLH